MLSDKKTKDFIIAGIILILAFTAVNHVSEIFSFLKTILGFVSPFLVGGALAFIVNIPMKKIEDKLFKKKEAQLRKNAEEKKEKKEKKEKSKALMRLKKLKKVRRILAYLITVFIILVVLSLVIFVVVPQLKDAFKSLSTQIPEAYEKLKTFLKSYGIDYPFISGWLNEQNINWSEFFSNLWETTSKTTFGFVQTGIDTVTKIVSALASFFVGIVVSIYILFQKEKLLIQSKKLLYALFSEKTAKKTERLLKLTSNTFSSFFTGQFLEALILGSMFIVTMLIIRLPYAFLIGLLISVCALIPLVGSFIACAVGIILMAMVSPVKMVIFVVMFLILQQIEGQLIYPHVVGKTIGLPGIFVLFSVIVGGRIFGATGILLCIPTCSLIYCLVGEFVNKRLNKKDIDINKANSDQEA